MVFARLDLEGYTSRRQQAKALFIGEEESRMPPKTRSGRVVLDTVVTKKVVEETVKVVVPPIPKDICTGDDNNQIVEVVASSTEQNEKVEVISSHLQEKRILKNIVVEDSGKVSRKQDQEGIPVQVDREQVLKDLEVPQIDQEAPPAPAGGNEEEPLTDLQEVQKDQEEHSMDQEQQQQEDEEGMDEEETQPAIPTPPQEEEGLDKDKGKDEQQQNEDEETFGTASVSTDHQVTPTPTPSPKEGTKKRKATPKRTHHDDERKGRKKKRAKVGSSGIGITSIVYKRYVYRVLKQVHPELAISSKAMTIVNNMMNDMCERISEEGSRLSRYSGRKTLSSWDIQDAVKLVLPGECGKHAMAEGSKAVNHYLSSLPGQSYKSKSKS